MKYLITGVDGKLAGRVAENMLKSVSSDELIFTCPNLSRLSEEKKKEWKHKEWNLEKQIMMI